MYPSQAKSDQRQIDLVQLLLLNSFPVRKHNPLNCILINPAELPINCNSSSNDQREKYAVTSNNYRKSKITLAHLNVRSLKNREHFLQIKDMIHEENYDIFAVSESWLNSTVRNAEVEITGYSLSPLDRFGKSGGGVCVYVKSTLKYTVLKDLTEISDSGFHQLWIQIQHKKLRSILLCVCYGPPDCPVSCFTNNFMAEYTRALIYGKDILVVGDLNCNLLKTTQEAEALRDICCSLNLVQLIDKPTRVTLQSSSLMM